MTCPLRYWHGQDCTTDCIYCADSEDDRIELSDEDIRARSVINGTIAAGALGLFITIIGTIAYFMWSVR
jgi:biotin synthase-like enzyme